MKAQRPPWLAQRLLSLVLRKEEGAQRLGDFEEVYQCRIRTEGFGAANRWYWTQVLRTLPPMLNCSRKGWGMMLKHDVRMAWRAMNRQRIFTLINLSGLAAGLAVFTLMMLYGSHEARFDGFHSKADRLCRVIRRYDGLWGKDVALVGGTPAPLAPTMVREFPEVVDGTCMGEVTGMIRHGDQDFKEEGLFADDRFLALLDFPLLRGNAGSVLSAPFSLVITERLARKIFGDADPLGQALHFSKEINYRRSGSRNEGYDVQVTGVLADVPANSHLQFNYLLSLNTLSAMPGQQRLLEEWGRSNYYNYVELRPGTRPEALHERLAAYSDRFRGGDKGRYVLQPFREIHWQTGVMDEMPGVMTVSRQSLGLLSALSLILLVIACMNYTNLTTARLTRRMKEIGLRKVLGGRRHQMVAQFLGESVFLAFLSLGVAVALAWMALPFFNRLIDRQLSLRLFTDFKLILGLVAATWFSGLLAGSYPAIFLSAAVPAQTLRRTHGPRMRGRGFRRILVVFQFMASVGLLASALIVGGQMRFVQNQSLGYDQAHVVVVPLRDENARAHMEALKAALLQNPAIESVSHSDFVPLERNDVTQIAYTDAKGEPALLTVFTSGIGPDFFDVFKMELVAGRPFDPSEKDEDQAWILNETAVKKLGWTDPVGHLMPDGTRIVGVVKDFHQTSLHDVIDPMLFKPSQLANFMTVRIQPGNIPQTLAFLKTTVEGYSPRFPFDSYFQEDHFQRQYAADRRFGTVFATAASLTLFVACLGILGLAAYEVERRMREIAIRKVVGAGTASIISRIVREFVLLVGIACGVAWPLAYWGMGRWLENFAYRMPLGPFPFVAAGLLVGLAALLAAGGLAFKGASVNPVVSIKAGE